MRTSSREDRSDNDTLLASKPSRCSVAVILADRRSWGVLLGSPQGFGCGVPADTGSWGRRPTRSRVPCSSFFFTGDLSVMLARTLALARSNLVGQILGTRLRDHNPISAKGTVAFSPEVGCHQYCPGLMRQQREVSRPKTECRHAIQELLYYTRTRSDGEGHYFCTTSCPFFICPSAILNPAHTQSINAAPFAIPNTNVEA